MRFRRVLPSQSERLFEKIALGLLKLEPLLVLRVKHGVEPAVQRGELDFGLQLDTASLAARFRPRPSWRFRDIVMNRGLEDGEAGERPVAQGERAGVPPRFLKTRLFTSIDTLRTSTKPSTNRDAPRPPVAPARRRAHHAPDERARDLVRRFGGARRSRADERVRPLRGRAHSAVFARTLMRSRACALRASAIAAGRRILHGPRRRRLHR